MLSSNYQLQKYYIKTVFLKTIEILKEIEDH